jgi:anti-anti-sigma regulatory factor
MNVFDEDDITYFKFETDITGEQSIAFQNQLKQSIADGKHHFSFHLENVNNIDTTGICAFIALKKQIAKNGIIDYNGAQDSIELLLNSI